MTDTPRPDRNANTALDQDPDRKEHDVDINDINDYPSSSEANPSPEDVTEEKAFVREKLSGD